MTRNKGRFRVRWLAWIFLAGFLALIVYDARPLIRETLFNLTGEEGFFSQVKGVTDLSADLLRPRLKLAPEAPVQYANLNPFGVNVFLNQEVEPAKREQTVRLAAEAGFHWLRQEFPWQDIEIHAKGDYEDRRNQPVRSAWAKYDEIVALAEKYGMELIVRVSTPPAWSRIAGEAPGAFAPPDNYADFGDFVYTLVNRYKGRIRFYQLWNEPNIYPEWGAYPISPEDYTRLLQVGATRAREANPDVVVIAGALASTIALQPNAAPPTQGLNDLLFLQRMYDAGAAPYFDIMAMQGYGLWSGPTDRRMHPRVINYGRPQFVRDVMVANGDAHKPIWISELGWNAVPDAVADKLFGQVTLEQQARYTAIAYQRALEEWPWLGVLNTWYFKRATDEWFVENRPEAYFRLADPDFTLLPVYTGLKDYLTRTEPALDPGFAEPRGWAVEEMGRWRETPAPDLPFGKVYTGEAGARLSFVFYGTSLAIAPGCSAAPCGELQAVIDGGEPTQVKLGGSLQWIARGLPQGRHEITLQAGDASVALGGLLVRNERWRRFLWLAPVLLGVLLLMWLIDRLRRLIRASRQELPQAAGWRPVARPRVRRQWGRRDEE